MDVLQRFGDNWFIIFTPKSLGELQYIHVWHDNYGKNPDWYCKTIEVIDLRRKDRWIFNVERRFSLLSLKENIEHTILAEKSENWQKQIKDDLQLTIREEHLWISAFIR